MKNWTVNAMEILQKSQARAYEMGHAELEPAPAVGSAERDRPGHQYP